jgi:hypothetical protein
MTRQAIIVGQVWQRRQALGDAYDVVRVCGLVDHAGNRENEYTIAPLEFGAPVLQTDAAGLLDYCDLLTQATEPEDWR